VNVFELILTDGSQSGLRAIATVEHPAIEMNFFTFSELQNFEFKASDPERRILTGPILIPDKLILREDPVSKEHFGVFLRKETIESAVQKFFRQNQQNTLNMGHNSLNQVQGVTMFESWITDERRGVLPAKGFEGVPDGTWFGSYKVENEEFWNEFIKTKKFLGFSIEAMFDMKPMATEMEAVEKAIDDLIKLIK